MEYYDFYPADEMAEPMRVAVDKHAADSDFVPLHVYHIEGGTCTLADLAQLVETLRQFEMPDVSAVEWADVSTGGRLRFVAED